MKELDLNNMSLDEVLAYCHERRKDYETWLLNLFIGNEGFDKAVEILAENGRI